MKNKHDALYISIDVESDGPCPGIHNLLSFGAAAFLKGKPLVTFERNIALLPDCKPSHKTMREFWQRDAKHQALYDLTRVNTVDPEDFCRDLIAWARNLSEETGYKAVFVAAPATFDYKWLDYYLHRFIGDNPFGFASCVDIKSYLFGRMDRQFAEVTKRNYKKSWFPKGHKHTHVAVEDAIEQGHIFVNAMRDYDGHDKLFDQQRLERIIEEWATDQGHDLSPTYSELVSKLMDPQR